ncbi:MAG: DUF4330 domain-containing protein [Candidatus Omnitrophota bacterium]
MKLIDAKGKLFGVVNIFDALVLAMLIVAALLCFQWFRMGEDPSWVRVTTFFTRCKAEVSVPNYLADTIKEGDEMRNREGLVVARIETILKNDPADAVTYRSKDGEKLFFDTEKRKLTVLLDILSFERLGQAYSVSVDAPIRVGERTYTMYAKEYSVIFDILDIVSKGSPNDAGS